MPPRTHGELRSGLGVAPNTLRDASCASWAAWGARGAPGQTSAPLTVAPPVGNFDRLQRPKYLGACEKAGLEPGKEHDLSKLRAVLSKIARIQP